MEPLNDPCRGFHWIGQTLESCDNCGRPAREHEGLHTLRDWKNARPFGDGFTDEGDWYIKPWSEVVANAE